MMAELQLWHMISLLLTFFGAIWAFWRYIKAKEEKEFDERGQRFDARLQEIDGDTRPLRQDMAALSIRLSSVEKDLERIRDSPVLSGLPAEVREMRACQKGMQSSMDVMRAALSRIEDYLLNGNRK